MVWWLKKGCGFRWVCILAVSWADSRLLLRPNSFRRSPLCSQAGGDLVFFNGLLSHFSLLLCLSASLALWVHQGIQRCNCDTVRAGAPHVVNRRECPEKYNLMQSSQPRLFDFEASTSTGILQLLHYCVLIKCYFNISYCDNLLLQGLSHLLNVSIQGHELW